MHSHAPSVLRGFAVSTHCAFVGIRQLGSLVLAEARGSDMSSSYPHLINAAQKAGGDITSLLVGSFTEDAARKAASFVGVTKVLTASHSMVEHLPAEPLAHLLSEVQKRHSFSHILAPANTFGKNLLPRAAALLGVQPVTDVIKIEDGDTFVRPVYAGNALATVKVVVDGVRMLTIRPTGFPAVQPESSSTSVSIESLEELLQQSVEVAGSGVKWEGDHLQQSERPELAAARVVVSGGRALKSAENFKMLESLADVLGGAVGASRAAVDAGFVSNDLQVGQTGKVVAPDLYIGVGISGAIQHLAGMKDAKTIVAINTDASAPIFQIADYGLVQDLFTAIPELEKQIRALKPKP